MAGSLIWFRQDLRLSDQPAVAAAAAAGPTLGLYVLDDETPGDWRIGGAQRWWLHHSLEALKADLEAKGGALILRRGRAADIVAEVADEIGAEGIHAVRHFEPWWRKVEEALGDRLTLHAGDVLAEPERVTTGAGKLFRIYTPFYRALSHHLPPDEPHPAPRKVAAPSKLPKSDALAAWKLLPTKPDWSGGFGDDWQPGEDGAKAHLRRFAEHVGEYETHRNLPAEEGTSRLSPHLHFGEISPRQLWHGLDRRRGAKFLKELAWRDFSRTAMLSDPEIGARSQRDLKIRWREGAAADRDFRAWTRGRTGYPIVDAGMRQLWTAGWMHNRVRMIVASFLSKHLLVDWRRGERWFWDTLVDADYGNNSLNWQWVAGTGTDSQLYTRIMAPLMQSAKFDAGDYIRRWVPELAGLDDKVIHDPHEAGAAPADYPRPLIGHREGRERALAALASKHRR